MTKKNEQVEIVKHYMEDMDAYRIEGKSYWDSLVETKLKGKIVWGYSDRQNRDREIERIDKLNRI